jgi:hypothetical protein
MTPHQAGALRNTAHLALDTAKDGRTQARRYGLELAPWDKAVRDAKVALKLAEKGLVMV